MLCAVKDVETYNALSPDPMLHALPCTAVQVYFCLQCEHCEVVLSGRPCTASLVSNAESVHVTRSVWVVARLSFLRLCKWGSGEVVAGQCTVHRVNILLPIAWDTLAS
jgi:hypothetical protein